MNACERYEADLSALLDGELEPAKEEELRAHMAGCAECTALYETFSLLHEDAQEPPADLAARIMDAVRSEAPDNVTPMPKKKNRWVPWLAAAACFVVIVGAVSVPRLIASRSAADLQAVSRGMPESEDTDPSEQSAAGAEAVQDDATDNGPLTTAAEPLAITDPTQIASVRAMLVSKTEIEQPEVSEPLLTLSEDGQTTTIWLDGDDVLFTPDGEQYFRCANAAEPLIEYLSEL